MNASPENRKHSSRKRLCTLICGHISLVAMMCCLGFCAVPGVMALVALSMKNNEWTLVDAVLVDKEPCDLHATDSPTSAPSESPSYSYQPSLSPACASSMCQEPSRSEDFEEQDPDLHGIKRWYVTYNYVTLEGQNLTSTGDYCTARIGNKVFYDPDDPESFMDVASLTHSLGFTKFMTSIGFVFVVVFFALMLWGYSRKKETASSHTTAVANHVLETPTSKNTAQVAVAMEIPLAVPADHSYGRTFGKTSSHPVAAAYPVAAATPVASTVPVAAAYPVVTATAFKSGKSKTTGSIKVYK